MTLIEYCAKKIVDGYPLARFDLERTKWMLQCFPDRFVSYRNTVGMFMRLSDESFLRLKRGELDLFNPLVVIPLMNEDGGHVHVISIVSDSVRDMLFLARWAREKSISWYTAEKRLVVFERS